MIKINDVNEHKFKLVLVSRNKYKIIAILNSIEPTLKVSIEKANGLYTYTCYGTQEKYSPIIKPSYVSNNVWIYEYKITKTIIYNAYSYKVYPGQTIPISIEILHETENLSIKDAIEIYFKDRLLNDTDPLVSNLVKISHSTLFKSMITSLVEESINSCFKRTIPLPQLFCLERLTSKLLNEIKSINVKNLFTIKDLTYDQFKTLVTKL